MAKLRKRIIGLITDFGPKGQHYIASMKGVILNINPEVNVVDISHNIAPFSIIEASYIFKTTYKYYPEGTVFIIVVDPGVGSSREILALKTVNNYYLVAPNNGIFLSSFELNDFSECIEITNEEFYNKPISKTFHGRDIMAPIAANITKGLSLSKFGAAFNPSKLNSYPIEFNKISDNEIKCTIQYIDNFGNIITNIKASSLSLKDGAHLRVKLKKAEFNGKFVQFFEKVIKGSLLFLVGSSGFLEISKNQGNAAIDLGVSLGDIITVLLSEVKNK